MSRRFLFTLFLLLTVLAIDTGLSRAADGPVDFRRDIQPILAKRCFTCHGPDVQEGGLRLDQKAEALRGGNAGPVLVPKKSGASRLLEVVTGKATDGVVMPPKGQRLTAAEVELLRRWIDEGADWPADAAKGLNHWAFQPVKKPGLPALRSSTWVRNPIDTFILARMEKEGIAPSPPADKSTLLRRLSLDLTGLPPTLEEQQQFAADASPAAYAKVVDHYLASPHYGEQWARHWLDLARYADTDGYEKDLYRPHAWRWREWVIDALNRDLPFDQFTIKQLAGDLLPNSTLEDRLATGFHCNTLLNREGGVDLEEDRTKAVVDRVSTVGTTWLGLTLGCAECHSHKYDPISQREFYQLYAFFNSTDEVDLLAPLPRHQTKVAEAEKLFSQIQTKWVNRCQEEDWSSAFQSWREATSKLPAIWQLPDSYELPTFGANNGANLYPQEDGSFLVTGTVSGNTHYIMMSNLKLDGITAIRLEAMTDEQLPKGGPGWAANGNFVLSELRVEAAPLKNVTNLKPFAIQEALADYSQKGLEIGKAVDGDEKTGWAVDLPHLPMHGVDRAAVFILKEPIKLGSPVRLKVSLVQHHGHSHTLGRLRVSYSTADRSTLAEQAVPQRIRDLCQQPYAQLPPAARAKLLHYWLATQEPQLPLLATYAGAVAAWRAAQGSTRGPVLVERQTRRPTHVHVRGDFLHRGEKVEAGFLAAISGSLPPGEGGLGRVGQDAARPHPPPQPSPSGGEGVYTRVDLARWLVKQPLTARVAVNRVWKHLFGEGIVRSLGDFGTQGDKPTHPELLDWLAATYAEQGWSQKQLIRLIVMSNAYQQSSATRLELVEKDATNLLLARQNRFRLPAENVRDQLLAGSSILERSIGGPSVPTGQPRRGLYVQLRRSQPEPLLTMFDAPASTTCCAKRERSNTPLQALSLLNDELYLKAARGLAQAVGPLPAEERLLAMFQRVLGRVPTTAERQLLTRLLNQAQAEFLKNPPAAGQWLKGNADPDLAARAVVARVILNLDEVVVRE